MFLLNSQQQKALEDIDTFLVSKEKIFILEGFAGTGKTTVITKLISARKFFNKEIVMAATTNKAVSVLQNMFGTSYEHVDFKTIHKLCKIKRQISSNGDVMFNLNEDPDSCKKKKTIYFYDVIIIDECSMISKKILSIIISLSQRISGKIIFIGDKYQLPPVNEAMSDVFNLPVKKNVLKKIVRCSDDVVKFSEKIRNSIDNGVNISTKGCKGETFKTFKVNKDWIDTYINKFNTETNNVLLAYTNNRCNQINNIIRNKIYGDLSKETFIHNEIIVFNNFYKETKILFNEHDGILSIEPIISQQDIQDSHNVFYTSQKAIISHTNKITLKMPNFPFESLFNLTRKLDLNFSAKKSSTSKSSNSNLPECPICFEKIKDMDTAQLNCGHIFCQKCIKLWLEQNDLCPYCRIKVEDNKIIFDDDEKLSELICKFKDLTDNKTLELWQLQVHSGKTEATIYLPTKEYDLKFKHHQDSLKIAIQNIKKYLDTKKTIKDKKYFVIKRLWEFYYYCYVDLFADISYGYCITVHKSQGSTFDDVYVDCNNIMKFKNNDTLNCLYTAVTRSSKTVYMLI